MSFPLGEYSTLPFSPLCSIEATHHTSVSLYAGSASTVSTFIDPGRTSFVIFGGLYKWILVPLNIHATVVALGYWQRNVAGVSSAWITSWGMIVKPIYFYMDKNSKMKVLNLQLNWGALIIPNINSINHSIFQSCCGECALSAIYNSTSACVESARSRSCPPDCSLVPVREIISHGLGIDIIYGAARRRLY